MFYLLGNCTPPSQGFYGLKPPPHPVPLEIPVLAHTFLYKFTTFGFSDLLPLSISIRLLGLGVLEGH